MLEAGLKSDDYATRWTAFSAIGSLGRIETFDLLLAGLAHADHGIRHSAVFSVKTMAERHDRRDQAVAALKEMLVKERASWDNAIAAAWALTELGVPINPRRFADALKQDGLDHRFCARALGEMKCREAVTLLLERFELSDTRNAWEFSGALHAITGEKLGRHPGPWREWLEAHRASLPPQWT